MTFKNGQNGSLLFRVALAEMTAEKFVRNFTAKTCEKFFLGDIDDNFHDSVIFDGSGDEQVQPVKQPQGVGQGTVHHADGKFPSVQFNLRRVGRIMFFGRINFRRRQDVLGRKYDFDFKSFWVHILCSFVVGAVVPSTNREGAQYFFGRIKKPPWTQAVLRYLAAQKFAHFCAVSGRFRRVMHQRAQLRGFAAKVPGQLLQPLHDQPPRTPTFACHLARRPALDVVKFGYFQQRRFPRTGRQLDPAHGAKESPRYYVSCDRFNHPWVIEFGTDVVIRQPLQHFGKFSVHHIQLEVQLVWVLRLRQAGTVNPLAGLLAIPAKAVDSIRTQIHATLAT
jgi:hypothetical protein